MTDKMRTYYPIPLDCFPRAFAEFIAAGAKAIDCPECMVALPLLTTIASAIGGAVRLQVKKKWIVPSILWTGIVTKSGSAKSPAFDLSVDILHSIATGYRKQYQTKLEQYTQELNQFERDRKQFERSKSKSPPPVAPIAPKRRLIKTNNWTIEALILANQDDPNGVFVACDELASWVGSFGSYSDKGAAESAQWLSMYNGGPIQHDRKQAQSLFVNRSNINVTGTIQPDRLFKIFNKDHLDSGLLARVLLCRPPCAARKLTNEDMPNDVFESVASRIRCLLEIQPINAKELDWQPHLLKLDPSAHMAFKRFYDSHNELVIEHEGAVNAALAKLSEIPLRLALVLFLFEWTTAVEQSLEVDLETMNKAIKLTDWFVNEAFRVYQQYEQTPEQLALEAMMTRPGEKYTVREWQQKVRFFKNLESWEAESLFRKLVADDQILVVKSNRTERYFVSASTVFAFSRDK